MNWLSWRLYFLVLGNAFYMESEQSQGDVAKHKISFETAALVFNDPYVTTFPDCGVAGEALALAVVKN